MEGLCIFTKTTDEGSFGGCFRKLCVCNQMCIKFSCTVVSQARPHKSVDAFRKLAGERSEMQAKIADEVAVALAAQVSRAPA